MTTQIQRQDAENVAKFCGNAFPRFEARTHAVNADQ